MALTPGQLRATRQAIEAAFKVGTRGAIGKLGPVGSFLAKLLGLSKGEPTAADFIEVGRQMARPIPIAPPPISRPGTPKPPPIPPGWSKPGNTEAPSPSAPEAPAYAPRGRTPQGAPPLPGEEKGRTEFVRTPHSTNVYGFYFEPDASKKRGILYVTYQAGDRSQSGGGSAKGRRANKPGAKYAYYDVPVGLYIQLLRVANAGGHEGGESSPGTFVWTHLRERGSMWGHKFKYRLIQGEIGPSHGGQGEYVPRKATKLGFRTRAITSLGSGRRAFGFSTLPEQMFVPRKRSS